MTDAAVSVTQSAVEHFTGQYLTSIGGSIEKHDDMWEVTIPEGVTADFPTGTFVLQTTSDRPNRDGSERQLYPESAFFQELLSDATDRQPTGKVTLTAEQTPLTHPSWLEQSRVDVVESSFTPYYDRTAVVVVYRVGVETVSEYQTELLRAVGIDTRSNDRLSNLETTFLDTIGGSETSIKSTPIDLERSAIEELLAETRSLVVDQVQPEIDEIHREASRAADAELEEYRQLQQQRIGELEENAANLSRRIDELSETVSQSGEQATRVDALKERKELKADHKDIESELEALKQRRERGFPEQQRAIRDRHALEVVVTPCTVTQIEYERGDLEVVVQDDSATETLTLGYGSGVGVTDEMQCEDCGQLLTEANPLQSVARGIQCSEC